jgi:3-oxoacyl-[acyl-carrier protein] reductase
MSLDGRIAVVTGAASGIGRSCCEVLARGGASVVAAGLDGHGLDETVERVRAAGGRALAVEADVSDAAAVARLAETTREDLGPADILVNNAAVYPNGPWFEVDEAEWDEVFAVNVKGYWLCARALRDQLRSRGRGSVVNVSSITFFIGSEGFLHYVSSKGAVIGLTRGLAREVGPEEIRVNAVAPGAFPTAAERLPGRDLERYSAEVLASQSLKRRGVVEDVANVVAFFASDASSFVTGQTLVVDGGWVMR